MILGIGTDIIEVERFDDLLARRGVALAERLLSDSEMVGFAAHQTPARYLAKRFAAKEAALKALGTGLRNGMRWKDISVEHDELGKPILAFFGAAKTHIEALGVNASHITISDERHYVVAFVIIERS